MVSRERMPQITDTNCDEWLGKIDDAYKSLNKAEFKQWCDDVIYGSEMLVRWKSLSKAKAREHARNHVDRLCKTYVQCQF